LGKEFGLAGGSGRFRQDLLSDLLGGAFVLGRAWARSSDRRPDNVMIPKRFSKLLGPHEANGLAGRDKMVGTSRLLHW